LCSGRVWNTETDEDCASGSVATATRVSLCGGTGYTGRFADFLAGMTPKY